MKNKEDFEDEAEKERKRRRKGEKNEKKRLILAHAKKLANSK